MVVTYLPIPHGWDYNPSSWSQRWPLNLLALIGFLIALYLVLCRPEVLASVWEPFFGKRSDRVSNSVISKALPVSDSLLGAFSYLLDAVTGAIGDTSRWRPKPWIVILFGIATGPLALVSVLLVIFQPVLVSAWYTLCLVTAVISIVMISPAMNEVQASLQYLQRVQREGYSVRDAFWDQSPLKS
jgi:hypothetical protein